MRNELESLDIRNLPELARLAGQVRASNRPLLLRVNLGAGHSGASGRYDNLREQAMRWAFVLDQLGLGPAPPAAVR